MLKKGTMVLNAGIELNMEDVKAVMAMVVPYLAVFAVLLIIGIVVIVMQKRKEKQRRRFIRRQAVIAILLCLVVTLNLICLQPVSPLLDLVFAETGEVAEETAAEAEALITEMAEEGIVLLKNESGLPLSTEKLNVFGWASTNPCYGGTGSGSVDTTTSIDLLSGLESNFELNQSLIDMYREYRDERPEVGMFVQDWSLPEPTVDYYTDELLDEAKAFSDTAVIVITRVGGEGADLPDDFGKTDSEGNPLYIYEDNSDEYEDFTSGQHYLQLSQTERNMVELVCSNFEDVVVIYNGANAFELGWVDEYEQIKGVLSCPGTGQTGFAALGTILSGEVNPSAKLADTFVYDLTATPTYNNFGDFEYDNLDDYMIEESGVMQKPRFVNYVENIYVGYKFYETAYAETESGNMNFDYEGTVQYPFGYGLSYTTFDQKITSYNAGSGTLEIKVEVTNTGDVAGKEVVQLYYTPPYENGGIEKAAVNLANFDKTAELQPGESEIVSFSITEEELASYDAEGYGAYVLEAGSYELSVRADAHTALDTVSYEAAETIVYDEDNKRDSDETAAVNQFEFAEGDVAYLSRSNGFENYEEVTAAPSDYSMSDEIKADFSNNDYYDPTDYNDDADIMPVTGAENGVLLEELRGLDYDDPLWDDLLDELTVEEMVDLIALGGYTTTEIERIGKIATTDNDGPATIYNNFTDSRGSAYPTEVLIANTWNKELAAEMGRSVGKQADELDVSGWYAPAMNTHRSAFAGRNFEYYSEDGVLSGLMAASTIQGVDEYGVYSYIKHFAMNDQETSRYFQLCTWSSEQAIREIYLKPFELAVKEGGSKAVMTAHNHIGSKWTASSEELLTSVLRNEWGFQGHVITDMFAGFGYQNADIAIRAGNDLMLSSFGAESAYVSDTESATSVIAMRTATHNILYTVVNSRAYATDVEISMAVWRKGLIVIDIILALMLIGCEVQIMRAYKRRDNIEISSE